MTNDQSVMSAFTADHVVRLTGLSKGQLAYWDRAGFFQPQYASESRRSPYSRIYSFKDVVGLRTLSLLRGGHAVSLPHLRQVAAKLSAYSKSPWSDIKLKVWNRKVQFDEPETGQARGVIDGQYVILPIIEVMEDVERGICELKQRDPAKVGQIERHRYVAHNAPVVAGTRIPVSTILRFVEDGFTPSQIVKEYPSLTEADIEAVIKHGKSGLAA